MPVGPLLSFVSERQTIGRQAQVYGLGSLLRLVNVGIASDVTYENDLVDGAAHLILPRKFLGPPGGRLGRARAAGDLSWVGRWKV